MFSEKMWESIKRLASALAVCVVIFTVSSWYHQVNGEISKIPVLVEEVSGMKQQVNGLTEIVTKILERFDNLSPEQQAALRDAKPEGVVE